MTTKICSDINNLEILHNTNKWIPGKSQIRPLPEIIDTKIKDLENIRYFYQTYTDYIYDEIFDCQTIINKDGKMEVTSKPVKRYAFKPNKYPYAVSDETKHYIIWYNIERDSISDIEIEKDIQYELNNLLASDKFEFVWYENPKKTFPEIFHFQVFWHKIG